MEQAQAGCGLQDVPATHAIPNGHVNGANGSMPEKEITYNTARQHASSKRLSNSKANGGVEDIALCASPAGFQARKHKRHSPEKESIGGMLCKAMVEHQLGISLNLLLLGALTYLLFPTLRERVGAFFTLQYPTGTPGEFSTGPRDIYIVAGYVVLFTAMRAACLDYVLLPLTGMLGIKQKKTKVRYVGSNSIPLRLFSANKTLDSRNKHTSCSTTSPTGAGA
jgi:acyl-CoA-dependent ceramide synthase